MVLLWLSSIISFLMRRQGSFTGSLIGGALGGLLVVAAAALYQIWPVQPPMYIENARSWQEDGLWKYRMDLVVTSRCQMTRLQREFWLTTKVVPALPVYSTVEIARNVIFPGPTSLGTYEGVGSDFKQIPGEKGTYRLVLFASGCENGFEGIKTLIPENTTLTYNPFSFDWTGKEEAKTEEQSYIAVEE